MWNADGLKLKKSGMAVQDRRCVCQPRFQRVVSESNFVNARKVSSVGFAEVPVG